MELLCTKSRNGTDLLGAVISIDGHDMEVCGLAKEEYRDGLMIQWWIVMNEEADKCL